MTIIEMMEKLGSGKPSTSAASAGKKPHEIMMINILRIRLYRPNPSQSFIVFLVTCVWIVYVRNQQFVVSNEI